MTGTHAIEKPGDDAGILITLRESPLPVKALLAGIFVNKLGAFLQVFLVLFLTRQGFTAVQAGAALSAYGAGSVAGVLVGGTLTDRLGPRRATLLSMTGTAALVLAVLYVHNYPALLVVVVLVAAVGMAYRPASAALLSELTPGHRQVMIFAIYRLALNLGTTAAPVIGAALASVSYHLLFWSEAVTALGYAVIAMVALPRERQPGRRPPGRRQVAESGSAPAESGGTGAGRPEDDKAAAAGTAGAPGYLAVLADRRFLLYLLAMLVNSAVYVQYLAVLPLTMLAAGLSTGWYAAVVALNGLIVITCELLMTKVVQRWPSRIVVIVGFALLGGGISLYAVPWGPGVFVAGTLVWSLAEIIAGPTMFAYPAMAAPAQLRGRYLGAAQAMFGLGAAIGPVVGVAVWHLVGRSAWLWFGLACVAGMAVAWWGVRAVAAVPREEVPEPPSRIDPLPEGSAT